MEKIPEFKTLDEEAEFWETHDSADYWDDMEEAAFEVDLHQNLLHPKLVVLAHRPEHCPRCRDNLDNVVIEHVVWNDGQLLVIRDVPTLRCRTNGHEYILEETLDRIESLLEIEKTQELQPVETMQIPVFSLATPAW
ncbi:MAG: CopG family antitoxin [Methyloligellaceae bacterium]